MSPTRHAHKAATSGRGSQILQKGYWPLALVLAAALTPPTPAQDNPNTDLPIKRVVMFSSGVAFFEHAGQVASKDDVMASVWADVVVTEDSLTRCISEIRRAIGDDAQVLVKTVPKRGYRFDVPVTVVGPDPARPTTYVALGDIYAVSGQPDYARNFYDAALEIDPMEPGALKAIAALDRSQPSTTANAAR